MPLSGCLQLLFLVNHAPSNGSVVARPSTGVSLATNFTIEVRVTAVTRSGQRRVTGHGHSSSAVTVAVTIAECLRGQLLGLVGTVYMHRRKYSMIKSFSKH